MIEEYTSGVGVAATRDKAAMIDMAVNRMFTILTSRLFVAAFSLFSSSLFTHHCHVKD